MSMKKRVILMVIGLLILVGAIIAVVAHNNKVAQEEAEAAASESSSQIVYATLISHDREDLASVTLTTETDEITLLPGEHSLEGTLKWYLKDHEDWTLVHNYQEIVSLGSTFNVYKLVEENVTDPNRLEEFGLKDPVSIVTIVCKDGTTEQIRMGNLSSDRSLAFCQVVGDDNVYCCNSTNRTYSMYTRNTIRLATITAINTDDDLISLYAKRVGERPIDIYYDENVQLEIQNGEAVYLTTSLRFNEPYHNPYLEVVNNLESEYLSNLTTPSVAMTIDADCQDFSIYGLTDEDPIFRETITTRSGNEGNYTYNTTDYLFGYFFGDDSEYIYFREGDKNMVLGVNIDCLANRSFDPFTYVNKLMFLNAITNVESGSVTYKDRSYTFTIEREDVDEESSVRAQDRLTVYTVNGSLVEGDHFTSLYRALIEIGPDYEILDNEPTYDTTDALNYKLNLVDGSTVDLTFYRMSEFYYVTQIDDHTWFATAHDDIENVLDKLDVIDEDIAYYGGN